MPRLYSIASSQAEVEDEVHLTVALVGYEVWFYPSGWRQGIWGLAWRKDRLRFMWRNANFRLPADPITPVIMVGPGTGIAPSLYART